MAVAIFLLISGIIGIGFGPVFLGSVSDYLSGGDPAKEAEALKNAIAITGTFSVWTAFHFWRAQQFIQADEKNKG